jgi:hypothetical protein
MMGKKKEKKSGKEKSKTNEIKSNPKAAMLLKFFF